MQWIKNIVDGLVEYYDTRDIYELVDILDITIIHKNFINEEVKARLIKTENEDFVIYLSDRLDEHEKKYVLAHELGHTLLHDISNDYYYNSNLNKDKLELQANYFAALLLLDERSFEKCYIENMSLEQLSSYFEVPKELIQYRLGCVI